MPLFRKSKHTSVPPWVADPSLLATDVKPPIIAAVSRINSQAPSYDAWWTDDMATDDRASRIVDELGRASRPAPWDAGCADHFKVNLFQVLQPQVVRERARYIGDADHLSQYDSRHNVAVTADCLYCRQDSYRAATAGAVARVLARCEERERHRRSLLSRSLEGLRNLVCGLGEKGFQNWVLRPELLSADLEPVVTQTIRGLNGWFGVPELRAWATPLTTAQRLDLVHERLARQLNDEVAAATAERRTAKMLKLLFAPHQVREIEPRLHRALLRACDRHRYPEYKLNEAFWKEVRFSMLRVMRNCEELPREPNCWLDKVGRWWNGKP